jgi:L-amino acid N-acyltransferase YncA
MEIRNYSEHDKSAAQAIFAKYWTDGEFLNELINNIDGNETCFYVAEREGDIVGIAGFRQVPEYLRAHATTENPVELYIVASKLQREGVGNILVQKVIEEVKKRSYTEIECYSPETHESSWKFYEKLGFTQRGIIKDPDDGYPGMLWVKIIS